MVDDGACLRDASIARFAHVKGAHGIHAATLGAFDQIHDADGGARRHGRGDDAHDNLAIDVVHAPAGPPVGVGANVARESPQWGANGASSGKAARSNRASTSG